MAEGIVRDAVFEQECGSLLRHLQSLEYLWRISDMDLIESEKEENLEDIIDRLDARNRSSSSASTLLDLKEEGRGTVFSDKLFEILQQGKTLCNLVNVLKPGAIKKVNKQASRQFLGKENIWRFLAACKSELDMAFEDLFSVSDCFSDDVVKQRKVLKTLELFLKKVDESVAPKVAAVVVEEKPREVKKREQKANVIKELVETEKTYVRDLNTIRDDITRLEKAGVLTKEQVYGIFGNIRDILKFQATFLRSLEDCPPEEIGALFQKWAKEFSIYGPYCLNHESAGSVVASLTPLLARTNMKLEPKFELGSFLLKPVQRICKYPLLLKELAKSTDENPDEHAGIMGGLAAMKGVTIFINDLKKRRQDLELVKQLESKIENWDEKGDMRVYGVLKFDGVLSLLQEHGRVAEYHCFAFEKLFMYCKEDFERMFLFSKEDLEKKEVTYKFKGKVLLSDTGTQFHLLAEGGPGFRLISAAGEQLVFKAKNEEQLSKWAGAIRVASA